MSNVIQDFMPEFLLAGLIIPWVTFISWIIVSRINWSPPLKNWRTSIGQYVLILMTALSIILCGLFYSIIAGLEDGGFSWGGLFFGGWISGGLFCWYCFESKTKSDYIDEWKWNTGIISLVFSGISAIICVLYLIGWVWYFVCSGFIAVESESFVDKMIYTALSTFVLAVALSILYTILKSR